MRFFITGTAGFIGHHCAARLLDLRHEVVGVDAFTPYYDVALKRARAERLERRAGFTGHRVMLEDREAFGRAWSDSGPIDVVIHLAAQAGVRYSLDNPRAYLDANVTGTFNLLDAIHASPVRHVLLASTSSVYGCNTSVPFKETDQADHPLTFYAASKRATELMAHSFSHLHGLPVSALRFFTVYGPWGRPDMAPYRFLDAIRAGRPISVYNHGRMARDFTYVADIVEAVIRLVGAPPPRPGERAGVAAIEGDSLSPVAPYRVVNIGGGRPVQLLDFIAALESAAGAPARRIYADMQQGDMPVTYADTGLLQALTDYRPSTTLDAGIEALVAWYESYHA